VLAVRDDSGLDGCRTLGIYDHSARGEIEVANMLEKLLPAPIVADDSNEQGLATERTDIPGDVRGSSQTGLFVIDIHDRDRGLG
jgi:hypothetical protein